MIECRCAHFRHREYLDVHEGPWVIEKIMMYVIAGRVAPRTWIPCTECGKIAFWIDEQDDGPRLRVVEGGG
jgi:hypothetical protein